MIEAAFTFGVVIFIGITLILVKLPKRMSLWLLGHALMLDISITVLALAIHWGTVTGLMAATVTGLMCSAATSFARWLVGYTRSGRYYPGVIKVRI